MFTPNPPFNGEEGEKTETEHVPGQEPEMAEPSQGNSSVDLLMELQAEVEREQEPKADKDRARRAKMIERLCIALTVGCIALGVGLILALGQVNAAQRENALLVEEMSKLERTISEKEAEVDSLEKTLKTTRSDRDKLRRENIFWQNSAVLVTTEGAKYHRYDCQFTRNRSFYIYNVENAKYLGYKPCSMCAPPE